MCSAGDPASVRMTLAMALCAASPAASRAVLLLLQADVLVDGCQASC
jgi:hypothetical protein